MNAGESCALLYGIQKQGAALVAQVVKSLPAMWETRVRSLSGEYPASTPVFLPG